MFMRLPTLPTDPKKGLFLTSVGNSKKYPKMPILRPLPTLPTHLLSPYVIGERGARGTRAAERVLIEELHNIG